MELFSQPYLHFPYDNASWKCSKSYADPWIGCNGVGAMQVATDRDSFFNGHRYFNFQKLGESFYDYGPAACGIAGVYGQVSGWVWTDTTSGRTYLYEQSTGQDTLLYDVSLQVGDTFVSALTPSWATHVVTGVDTIVVNGLPRRRVIVFDNSEFVEYFMVEGMGSSAGPLVHLGGDFDHNFSVLHCYNEDSVTVWFNPPGTALPPNYCFNELVTEVEEALQEPIVKVGPLPANDHLRLVRSRNEKAELRMFSTLGTLVGKWTWDQGNEISLSISGLSEGIYILEIRSNLGLARKRVLIKR